MLNSKATFIDNIKKKKNLVEPGIEPGMSFRVQGLNQFTIKDTRTDIATIAFEMTRSAEKYGELDGETLLIRDARYTGPMSEIMMSYQ